MRAALAILVVVAGLGSATPSRADDSFEAKATGAQKIRRIEDLVWALTAPCDAGDDTQQRQCRHVRDARAAELATATMIVDADRDAFDVGAWNAQKKSVPISLSACIRCAGVEIDGKTWYVVGTGTAPHFEGQKLVVASLHDNTRTFADEATAKVWSKAVSNVHVQLVVKLPAKPRWSEGAKNGIALDVLAYRVFTPCDGGIVAANPSSGPAQGDGKACAPITIEQIEDATAVDALTPAMIDEAMQPVVDASHKCFGRFGVSGKAKLKLTILGDGTLGRYEQQGDFSDTPTGQCLDKAMAKAKFPHTKKPKTTINFPITLQQ